MCGGVLGDLAVTVDVTFAAGQLGPRVFAEVPYRVSGWGVCAGCTVADPLLMRVLESGELAAVIPPSGCVVSCRGHRRSRVSRFWSPFRGATGVPADARCPVCWGPIEVPEET